MHPCTARHPAVGAPFPDGAAPGARALREHRRSGGR